MDSIPEIGKVTGFEELASSGVERSSGSASAFAERLKEAVRSVDGLQQESEAAQVAYARGADIDLHDVLIKIEEAEVAFKTMMEIRNKLVDAYREVMRMGG